jgi:hypothetical protein
VRPRVHTLHYHGVFAPHAAWRPIVVDRETIASGRAEAAERREQMVLRKRKRRSRQGKLFSSWCPWSELLERIFGEGGFRCPKCHGTLSLRTVIHDPVSAAYILGTLGRSARAGPTGPLYS